MSEEDDATLVMPFVCSQSEGGPFEDRALSAGYQLGQLRQFLLSPFPTGVQTVSPFFGGVALPVCTPRPFHASFMLFQELEKQADMIAMDCGFSFEVLGRDEVWIHAAFVQLPPNEI